jgi:hypothetical protein
MMGIDDAKAAIEDRLSQLIAIADVPRHVIPLPDASDISYACGCAAMNSAMVHRNRTR